jgi:hypothetical protein
VNVSPDPQAIADQEAYSPGTRWCAVVSYPDGSGILGVYGPYRAKARATSHVKALQEAGIHRLETWEILPIRKIDLGADAP